MLTRSHIRVVTILVTVVAGAVSYRGSGGEP
jgi:hypothetical protein